VSKALGIAIVVSSIAMIVAGTPAASPPKSKAVLRANALCAKDDAMIRADEDAGPVGVFSIRTVDAILGEVDGLQRLQLRGALRDSFADWTRAWALIRSGFGGPPTIDGLLLRAQQAARRHGLECSFGVRPLSAM
jgi:hypothetical protein